MTTRKLLKLSSLLATAALLLSACGSDGDPSEETTPETETTNGDAGGESGDASGEPVDGPTILLRGQDFSEAITLAEVYGQYLQARGYDVEILDPAGFRVEAIQDLEAGTLNMIVDYIGGSQAELVPDAAPSSETDEVMEVISEAYAEMGATVLDPTPAVDGDAFVVRGDLEAESISDVADMGLVLGASAQCFERPQCYLGFTDPDVYGIEFADTQTIEFGPLLGEALAAGEVDAVIWNDTAPQIEENGFKVLEDDQALFPAQNVAPILDDALIEAYGDDLVTAINELSAQIETEDLLAWNYETDIEFRESDDVAADWLEEHGLL